MKRTIIVMLSMMIFVLSGCNNQQEESVVTLSTDQLSYTIIRGEDFESPALYADGTETTEYELTTDFDNDITGEYSMTYTVGEVEHTIDITVIPNDMDLLIEVMEATQLANSIELTQLATLEYQTRSRSVLTEITTYLKVYNEYAYVEIETKTGFSKQYTYIYMREDNETRYSTYMSTDDVCYQNLGQDDIEEDDSFLGLGIMTENATLLETEKFTNYTLYHVEFEREDIADLIETEIGDVSLLNIEQESIIIDFKVIDGLVVKMTFDLTPFATDFFTEYLDLTLDNLSYEIIIENINQVEAFQIPFGKLDGVGCSIN